MSIIQINNLVKKFGDFTAVSGITFSVEQGEIFGFLGPNGAGKSTTIKILSTLLKPTSGNAELAGYNVASEPSLVRQAIGMVFQDPSLDNRLTAEENLQFHGMLYNIPFPLLKERIDLMLGMVELTDRRKSLVKTFSGGMKRRLEIARGLLHHPKVLFLDEPTVGLDPQTRSAIWNHVQKLRDEIGITIFMTTHYMDEAENCDRIAIIDHGRIQDIGTPVSLKRNLGGDKVIVKGDTALQNDLAHKYQVQVQIVENEYHFLMPNGAEFIPLVVSDFPNRIKAIQVKEPSLDDVFLQLTGRAIRNEEGSNKDMMRQHMQLRRRMH